MKNWHYTYIQNPTEHQMAAYYGIYDMFNPEGVLIIHHKLYGDVVAAFSNIPDALVCFAEQKIQSLPGTAKLSTLGLNKRPILLIESTQTKRPIPCV